MTIRYRQFLPSPPAPFYGLFPHRSPFPHSPQQSQVEESTGLPTSLLISSPVRLCLFPFIFSYIRFLLRFFRPSL